MPRSAKSRRNLRANWLTKALVGARYATHPRSRSNWFRACSILNWASKVFPLDVGRFTTTARCPALRRPASRRARRWGGRTLKIGRDRSLEVIAATNSSTRLFTARGTDQMELSTRERAVRASKRTKASCRTSPPVRGGGHGPVELRIEWFAHVVVAVGASLRLVHSQDLRGFRHVIAPNQVPCRSGILAGGGVLQELRLQVGLVATQGGNVLLHRVEVVPPVLAKEQQPDMQHGGPHAVPPVGGTWMKPGQVLVAEDSLHVGAPVAQDAQAPEPDECFGSLRGRLGKTEHPCYLECRSR